MRTPKGIVHAHVLNVQMSLTNSSRYRPELAGENDLQTALSSKDINYGDVNKHLDMYVSQSHLPILQSYNL